MFLLEESTHEYGYIYLLIIIKDISRHLTRYLQQGGLTPQPGWAAAPSQRWVMTLRRPLGEGGGSAGDCRLPRPPFRGAVTFIPVSNGVPTHGFKNKWACSLIILVTCWTVGFHFYKKLF